MAHYVDNKKILQYMKNLLNLLEQRILFIRELEILQKKD